MPEIKNYFVKGRMNKDLDERLIPKGEYREAQNVQISNSEDSDVGAVENILGNKLAYNLITKFPDKFEVKYYNKKVHELDGWGHDFLEHYFSDVYWTHEFLHVEKNLY